MINKNDLQIDVFTKVEDRNAFHQGKNTYRMTHKPTGISVEDYDQRIALDKLEQLIAESEK